MTSVCRSQFAATKTVRMSILFLLLKGLGNERAAQKIKFFT